VSINQWREKNKRMKKIFLILAVLNLMVLVHAQESINITYIANDGFLISSGSGNILIDALFNKSFDQYDVPSEQLRTEIIEGRSSFDKVGLFLVTHKDGDHFYAPYIIDFLKTHRETRFVSSDQVNEKLLSDSGITTQLCSISIELGAQVDTTIAGVPLKIYRVRHSGDSTGTSSVNLAYLITLNNFKILHIGDGPIDFNRSYYDRFNLEHEKIDIVFLNHFLLSDKTKQFVQTVLKPKYIIAMHVSPKDVETKSVKFLNAYQNGIVFKTPMETKTFVK
jgi:L-ascorbate metabolism protein UlaG (beta-lactamase superfamily)